MTWALHIWNWHFLYYESSNTNPLENFPDQPSWWTPPSSAGKYMQIVHYKLKKIKLQNFLENITLVSKILKIVSKAYGVGLTRKDTLGFFTNCFLFIFSELRFLESWFTQVFCHCRNWKQKRNTSLSKKKRKSCSSAIQADSAFIEEAVDSLVEEKSRRRLGKFVNWLFGISFLYHLFNRLKKHFDAQFVM